jgi:hypothetical protein
MPDIHTIRLREPWTSEPLDGKTVWRRSFNWPAGLTAREVVWLVIEGLPATSTVEVNEEHLTADALGRFEITRLIAESNRIAITLADAGGDNCPFDVRLEIDEG